MPGRADWVNCERHSLDQLSAQDPARTRNIPVVVFPANANESRNCLSCIRVVAFRPCLTHKNRLLFYCFRSRTLAHCIRRRIVRVVTYFLCMEVRRKTAKISHRFIERNNTQSTVRKSIIGFSVSPSTHALITSNGTPAATLSLRNCIYPLPVRGQDLSAAPNFSVRTTQF